MAERDHPVRQSGDAVCETVGKLRACARCGVLRSANSVRAVGGSAIAERSSRLLSAKETGEKQA